MCVAALAILDRLDVIDEETLGWWLCERQLPNGGLNGRPEKLEDVRFFLAASVSFKSFLRKVNVSYDIFCHFCGQVCYSFWVLSAMAILDKIPWIDADKLTAFILSAQVPFLFFLFHPA